MGKRSRKRGEVAMSTTTRAERDAARRRRAEALARSEAGGRPARRTHGRTSFEDRPPAPWGSFPLVELVVLLGLILMVLGFFVVNGPRQGPMVVGGLVLASLGGLELIVREHFAGFRSHTTVLAAVVTLSAITAMYIATGNRALLLPVLA